MKDDKVVKLTGVRTADVPCNCSNPRRNHYGFVWDRANGQNHLPQTFVKNSRLK